MSGPNHPLAGDGASRSVDLDVPASALAVGAHPDDVEFHAGATLAKWAAAGCTVNHLVLTDGSKGTWDPGADIAELVRLREAEQRAAAARLGATGEVELLRWTDGLLDAGPRQVAQVAAAIRRTRPDVVLGHDPWRRYRLHPDHRNAGWIVCDAVVAARDPAFLTELALGHHRPAVLLLWEADEPDHFELADDDAIATKVAALLEHRSQFVTTHGIDDPADEDQIRAFGERVRRQLLDRGAAVGLPPAESFKLLRP